MQPARSRSTSPATPQNIAPVTPPKPPRVDRADASRQVAGTRYNADEQARLPRPTGGADARERLHGDPDASLDELIEHVVEGGTLADWCRVRGLAYSTVMHWLQREPKRAAAYERARMMRAEQWAQEIIAIADRSSARSPAEVRRELQRMRAQMRVIDRLMPNRTRSSGGRS